VTIKRYSLRNVRRARRQAAGQKLRAMRDGEPPLLNVDHPAIKALVLDITTVLTGTIPPTRAWFDMSNLAMNKQGLGGILVAPVENHPDKLAITVALRLRGQEAFDVSWGVGKTPHSFVSRKRIVEQDPTNPKSEFSQLVTAVVLAERPPPPPETPAKLPGLGS